MRETSDSGPWDGSVSKVYLYKVSIVSSANPSVTFCTLYTRRVSCSANRPITPAIRSVDLCFIDDAPVGIWRRLFLVRRWCLARFHRDLFSSLLGLRLTTQRAILVRPGIPHKTGWRRSIPDNTLSGLASSSSTSLLRLTFLLSGTSRVVKPCPMERGRTNPSWLSVSIAHTPAATLLHFDQTGKQPQACATQVILYTMQEATMDPRMAFVQ